MREDSWIIKQLHGRKHQRIHALPRSMVFLGGFIPPVKVEEVLLCRWPGKQWRSGQYIIEPDSDELSPCHWLYVYLGEGAMLVKVRYTKLPFVRFLIIPNMQRLTVRVSAEELEQSVALVKTELRLLSMGVAADAVARIIATVTPPTAIWPGFLLARQAIRTNSGMHNVRIQLEAALNAAGNDPAKAQAALADYTVLQTAPLAEVFATIQAALLFTACFPEPELRKAAHYRRRQAKRVQKQAAALTRSEEHSTPNDPAPSARPEPPPPSPAQDSAPSAPAPLPFVKPPKAKRPDIKEFRRLASAAKPYRRKGRKRGYRR